MSHTYDLVVVGLGSGGIVAAQFAANLRLRVAAIERDRVGGDCLWTGCVPSKALIASARRAHVMRSAERVAITPIEPDVDLAAVWRRMRAVRAQIAATTTTQTGCARSASRSSRGSHGSPGRTPCRWRIARSTRASCCYAPAVARRCRLSRGSRRPAF